MRFDKQPIGSIKSIPSCLLQQIKSQHYRSRKPLTFVCKKAKLLFRFSILWTRMRPLFGLPSFSPEIISSNFRSFTPSAKSTNRSSTSIFAWNKNKQILNMRKWMTGPTVWQQTLTKNEFIHFVNVFFWICKRSSCSVLIRSFSNFAMPSRCVMLDRACCVWMLE